MNIVGVKGNCVVKLGPKLDIRLHEIYFELLCNIFSTVLLPRSSFLLTIVLFLRVCVCVCV